MAEGRQKPIVPRPPEVMNWRGSEVFHHCAANIWCSPTPVVTIALPPVFCQRRSITYCGSEVLLPLLLVLERVLLPPVVHLLPPGGEVGLAVLGEGLADLLGELREEQLQVADERHRGGDELRDLRRVDVEVDDLRLGRERRELAR